jgi:proline racemase
MSIVSEKTERLFSSLQGWQPPSEWVRVATVDAHAAGEPLRIILSGFPEVKGKTVAERRKFCMQHYDHLRRLLMWEPRGHADMYGCFILSPVTPDADFSLLFMHNEGFSTMCGHGTIAVCKVVIEMGAVPPHEPETILRLDTPAGLVTATASVVNRKVERVAFRNVPSFVVALDQEIEVPELGRVRYDLAFGGAFYAFVEAAQLGLRCTMEEAQTLIHRGRLIQKAVMAERTLSHPLDDTLGFLYGTIFVAPPSISGCHSRNACVFAEGQLDRSPTGTGVSARLAIHHARGEICVGSPITIESIIGSRFAGRIVDTTSVGNYAAVIPEIEGTAHITGRHEFFVDPSDDLARGFLIR